MIRSLWTAASGMKAQQTNVDTISNNLANVNTVGYKSEKAEFKSLLYQTLQSKTTTANGENKPIGAQVGLGSRVASISSTFTQGTLVASDSTASLAINGDGFFSVRGGDGNTYYTRNGNFNWSIGQGGVVTLSDANGNPVLDSDGQPIVIPDDVKADSVVISKEGKISGTRILDEGQGGEGAKTETWNSNQAVGIFQFANSAGLEKKVDSLYAVTDASGAPVNEAEAEGIKKSVIAQKFLEGSNVQVADEMVNLIVAQRAYELNSKAIQAADSMMEQANQLRR